MSSLLKRRITKDQSRDTGLALVLLLLLVFLARKQEEILFAAVVLQIVNMIVPQIFYPFALIWLGLSDLLGAVVPRILLGLVFFAVVTPVAFVRRLLGRDALRLRAFKAGNGSVMLDRRHLFTSVDLEKPY